MKKKKLETELEPWQVKAFVNNAQVALADVNIKVERLDYLVGYSVHLEEVLRESDLTTDELAFVLVSTAYNLKFPGGK